MTTKKKLLIAAIVLLVVLLVAGIIYWENTHGNRRLIDNKYRFNRAVIGLPNRFITHGSMEQLLAECGLSSGQIAQRVKEALEARKHGG